MASTRPIPSANNTFFKLFITQKTYQIKYFPARDCFYVAKERDDD